jgi:hypothetical protein
VDGDLTQPTLLERAQMRSRHRQRRSCRRFLIIHKIYQLLR